MSKGTVINHSIMAIQPTETPAVAAVAQPEKTIVPAELSMNLPIVDLDVFLQKPRDAPEVLAECQKAANALITYGALVLHDSRVSEDDNTTFLDLLEDYFAQSEDDLRRDERPELGYQIGVTLENTEKPKCAVDEPCLQVIERLDPAERPLDIKAHEPDPKCRFFWRMMDAPPTRPSSPLSMPRTSPRGAAHPEQVGAHHGPVGNLDEKRRHFFSRHDSARLGTAG
ncbi:hypothetical protein PG987_009878 [Apiospora arundinis]